MTIRIETGKGILCDALVWTSKEEKKLERTAGIRIFFSVSYVNDFKTTMTYMLCFVSGWPGFSESGGCFVIYVLCKEYYTDQYKTPG